MAAKKTQTVVSALKRAADDLTAEGVGFAVVGGLAVSVRGEPRFTRDVDFAVRSSQWRRGAISSR